MSRHDTLAPLTLVLRRTASTAPILAELPPLIPSRHTTPALALHRTSAAPALHVAELHQYPSATTSLALALLHLRGPHRFAFLATSSDLISRGPFFSFIHDFQYLVTRVLRVPVRYAVLVLSPPVHAPDYHHLHDSLHLLDADPLFLPSIPPTTSHLTRVLNILSSSFPFVTPTLSVNPLELTHLRTVLQDLLPNLHHLHQQLPPVQRSAALLSHGDTYSLLSTILSATLQPPSPARAPRTDGSSDFVNLVADVSSTFGVTLPSADRALLRDLPGASATVVSTSATQLATLGICISHTTISLPSDSPIIQFHHSTSALHIAIDSRLLTPAGLSLAMWTLPPAPEHASAILRLLRTTPFRNALLAHVLQERRSGEPMPIALPRAWLFWLGLCETFLNKRVTNGVFAVRIDASDDKSAREVVGAADTQEGPAWGSRFRSRAECLANIPGGADGRERLVIVRENEDVALLYQPDATVQWHMGAIGMAGEALGLTSCKSDRSDHMEEDVTRGYGVRLQSMSEFLALEMRFMKSRNFVRRLWWLQSALDVAGVFPDGENIGWLAAVLESSSGNRAVRMFPDIDCRVSKDVLVRCGARMARGEDGVYVYFMESIDDGEGDGEEEWFVVSCEPDEDLLRVVGFDKCERISLSGLEEADKALG